MAHPPGEETKPSVLPVPSLRARETGPLAPAFVAGIVLSAMVAGCGGPARAVEHGRPMVPTPLFVDGAGNPLDPLRTPDAATLQKVARLVRGRAVTAPVVAPDGHRISWGEFKRAAGRVRLTCGDGGTEVRLALRGLVANATYSAWLAFFEPPGFLVNGFHDLSGFAPVGPPDGSQSVFRTDGAGNASVEAVTPAGTVTMAFVAPAERIAPCLLDALEMQVMAAYHIDGKTCGRIPCSEDSMAEHVGWLFERGRPEVVGGF